MMPGMDGEETLHAIRKLKGDSYKTLPVIVLTANASQGAKEMFIDMGFQDFIPKPLEMRLLPTTNSPNGLNLICTVMLLNTVPLKQMIMNQMIRQTRI